MQSKDEIEEQYKSADPWGFQTNPEDHARKDRIIKALNSVLRDLGMERFERALDLGAGEGWITKDLPAKEKWAYDISRNALERLPDGVVPCFAPSGSYDLVIATGVLYGHYDWKYLCGFIEAHADKVILFSHIADWEIVHIKKGMLRSLLGAEEVHTENFKYREYRQSLRVWVK